jgi:hypothetical protein
LILDFTLSTLPTAWHFGSGILIKYLVVLEVDSHVVLVLALEGEVVVAAPVGIHPVLDPLIVVVNESKACVNDCGHTAPGARTLGNVG